MWSRPWHVVSGLSGQLGCGLAAGLMHAVNVGQFRFDATVSNNELYLERYWGDYGQDVFTELKY